MKKDNKTKKNSAMKKLVPATGMLLVSAIMLTTATYAWFTMSREVEVQNIQMTATVPEDIQISLGQIGTTNAAVSETAATSLAANNGFLVSADNVVAAPREHGDQYDSIDWSNTADISNYYAFGKLIPASSTTGQNIFFTPDANGVGKTVDPNGRFYQAANGSGATAAGAYGSGTGAFNATTFAYTSTNVKNSSGTWTGYSTATAWNSTNDDGYYIDIPVWLRTSSTQGAELTVKAYVKDVANADASNQLAKLDSGTAAGEKLYKAVRVAVLSGNATTLNYNNHDIGMLDVADTTYGSGTVLNWYQRSANNGSGTKTNANNQQAVASINGSGTATYASGSVYNGTDKICMLGAGTGTEYGNSTKFIIRVWLEGEDPDCWNDTAGQDWSINLKFENTTTKTT